MTIGPHPFQWRYTLERETLTRIVAYISRAVDFFFYILSSSFGSPALPPPPLPPGSIPSSASPSSFPFQFVVKGFVKTSRGKYCSSSKRENFISLAKEYDMVEWVDNRTQVVIVVKKQRQPSDLLITSCISAALRTLARCILRDFPGSALSNKAIALQLTVELTELGHTDRDQFVFAAPHPTPAIVFPHVAATWWLEQIQQLRRNIGRERDVKKPVRVMDIANSSPVHILPSDPDRKHKKHAGRTTHSDGYHGQQNNTRTGSRSTAQKARQSRIAQQRQEEKDENQFKKEA
ncbi:hypothetical protein C5167_019727 [Papaver somniferum]|uniref:Uncharacterized protein n=1 Tax=Papaver somniferum TaxID=3469 RepID=A0A4Y7IUX3_PAPSO|nr:hypothetical protein C5167_019727 [Papaver somniferum]